MANYKCTMQHILVLATVLISIKGQSIPPGVPEITAPTYVVNGNTVTLSCSSEGGSPPPGVHWYRGTVNAVLVDDTETTVGVVTTNNYTFTVDKSHHRAVFECQVDNNVLQNTLTVTTFFDVYITPTQPTITGPSGVTAGTEYQWTCTSSGGYPAPTMTFKIGNTQLTTGIAQTSVLQSDSTYIVTSVLTWTPIITNNGQSLYCEVSHQGTNSDQTVNQQLTVTPIAAAPNQPTITGSSEVSAGTENQWTCISSGGYPVPTVTFRIGNTQLTTGISQTSVIQSDGTYTVTSVLTWTPSETNSGQLLYCVVNHQELSSEQTVNQQLTVNAGPITGAATNDTSLSAGEIAAIILAILFLLLFLLLLLYCCCKGYCACICCGKKEKVTPEKTILAIPKFYEKPVAVIEQPPAEYEINKYVVLKPDRYEEIDSRDLSSERGLDSIYVTTSSIQGDRVPPIAYSYDEEEKRRKRRRRHRKKKSSRRHHHDDQSLENEIVVDESIENGDVRHSPRKSDYKGRDSYRYED